MREPARSQRARLAPRQSGKWRGARVSFQNPTPKQAANRMGDSKGTRRGRRRGASASAPALVQNASRHVDDAPGLRSHVHPLDHFAEAASTTDTSSDSPLAVWSVRPAPFVSSPYYLVSCRRRRLGSCHLRQAYTQEANLNRSLRPHRNQTLRKRGRWRSTARHAGFQVRVEGHDKARHDRPEVLNRRPLDDARVGAKHESCPARRSQCRARISGPSLGPWGDEAIGS